MSANRTRATNLDPSAGQRRALEAATAYAPAKPSNRRSAERPNCSRANSTRSAEMVSTMKPTRSGTSGATSSRVQSRAAASPWVTASTSTATAPSRWRRHRVAATTRKAIIPSMMRTCPMSRGPSARQTPPAPSRTGAAYAHVVRSATARSNEINVPRKPSTMRMPWADGRCAAVTGAGTSSRRSAASSPASSETPAGRRSQVRRCTSGHRLRPRASGR